MLVKGFHPRMPKALEPLEGAVRKSSCEEMGAIYTRRLQALGKGKKSQGGWSSLVLSILRHANCAEAHP